MAASRPPGGGGRDVRLTLQEAAKKLSLWHSATFRPILTHDDLEPILAAAGFVALPPPPPLTEEDRPAAAVRWREYAFLGVGVGVGRRRGNAVAGWAGPRPRLPYPRVDALHLRTYQAFLAAVEVYLGALRVPALFHLRCMPVSAPHDRVFDKVFRAMRNGDQDAGIILYRDGTLDDDAYALCAGGAATAPADVDVVGYHVIPGSACGGDLGYLRLRRAAADARAAGGGGCDEETCRRCADGIDVVRLKDVLPPRCRPRLPR